ncbi:MarR family winged helix-turn-helix transcriptional regulator [Kineococcus gynurae]|uniref:MarR family winged helix-turn-helix transcriptional regulator n=1 Tax=Kineococcus gynurae TaxID=452979 RepID=A0ABV5LQ00_9ACTN
MTEPAAAPPPLPDRPDGLVAALADGLLRQVRAQHQLKCLLNRGRSESERAVHLALFVLHDGGPQRAGALAEQLGTDPSTTSRQTAELVRLGLIEKLPDPDDRRASLLAVTTAGQDLVTQLRRRRDAFITQAVADLDDDELRTFTALTARFTAGVERLREDALAGCLDLTVAETPSPRTAPQETHA